MTEQRAQQTKWDLLKVLLTENPARSFSIVLVIFIAAFIEGIGVTVFIPIFELLKEGALQREALSTVPFLAGLIKAFDAWGVPITLGRLLFVLCFLLVLSNVMFYLRNVYLFHAIRLYEIQIREKVYNALLHSKWSYLRALKIGDISNLITKEVIMCKSAYMAAHEMVSSIATILTYLAFIFIISVENSFVILVVMGSIFFVFSKATNFIKNLGQRNVMIHNKFTEDIIAVFESLKSIKANSKEDDVFTRLKKPIKEISDIDFVISKGSAAIQAVYEPVIVCSFSLILMTTLYWLKEDLSQLISIFFLVYKMSPKILQFVTFNYRLNVLVPSFKFTHGIIEEASKEKDEKNGEDLGELSGAIQLYGVTLQFHKDQGPVLREVDMKVEPGDFVAIVGPTGSGKTTLVDLILGIISPTGGKVLVEGRDLREIDRMSWHRHIGYMGQDSYLFNASIRENITWGERNVSDAAIEKAVRLANFKDYIEGRPEKMDYIVGNRGALMSGGERQRLLLSRALLTDPDILIMDEPTSSLDNETELQIIQALNRLKGKKTILAVTHRLKLAMNANRLWVVSNGAVKEYLGEDCQRVIQSMDPSVVDR